MNRLPRFAVGFSCLAALLLAGRAQWLAAAPDASGAAATIAPAASGATCMAATVHPLATDAALAAFAKGGNAIDAAIAAGLTLGVVDDQNSGIGGGCLILIHRASGELVAIDGREKSPAAATRDMFIREGKAVAELSQTGALAPGVPGAVAAYQLALDKCGSGRLKLADLILPAADLAESGYRIDESYAAKLKLTQPKLAAFAGTKAALFKPDGSPYQGGDTLKQPDLAHTYRKIAELGPEWFYKGELARMVAAWMSANGGILSAQDFADYAPVVREPLVTTYRGYTIVGFPPPSSGGVHVAQMLNILENFDLAAENRRDPARALNFVIEAMKLAFADRAYWLGDPDFAGVPRGLIDKGYAKLLAAKIDADRATPVPGHGAPPAVATDFFGDKNATKHTTHIAVVDSEGNWVAMTQTINLTFGSKVIVPGTGVLLNDEMDDFSAQPGEPNAFGLVGGENNAIAPGKRPLSSMSPTIVLKDDKPILTVGAAGGPKIISQVLVTLVRRLDFDEPLAEALAAPRIHHQWQPDQVDVESTLPADIVEKLQSYGHKVHKAEAVGVTQAIEQDPAGNLAGVHDPRVPGKARGATRNP